MGQKGGIRVSGQEYRSDYGQVEVQPGASGNKMENTGRRVRGLPLKECWILCLPFRSTFFQYQCYTSWNRQLNRVINKPDVGHLGVQYVLQRENCEKKRKEYSFRLKLLEKKNYVKIIQDLLLFYVVRQYKHVVSGVCEHVLYVVIDGEKLGRKMIAPIIYK